MTAEGGATSRASWTEALWLVTSFLEILSIDNDWRFRSITDASFLDDGGITRDM